VPQRNSPVTETLRLAQQKLGVIQEAMAFVLPPPPVRGIGTGGGWKLYIEDRGGHGVRALEQVTTEFIARANQLPEVKNVFTTFNTKTPKIFANIDRTRAEKLDVPAERVLDTLEIYLGSAYVNDFNFLGRTYRVTAQAEGNYRDDPSDLLKLKTRSNRGAMVPLGSLTTFSDLTGAYRVARYNLYTAAEVQGIATPGRSTGEALAAIEKLAEEVLPEGYGFEWTDLALQEKARRQHRRDGFRPRRGLRVPGAGGAVRIVDAAARGHPHRADVPARLDHRRQPARHAERHPGADRFHRAHWSGRQERHPHRRVRAPGRSRRSRSS
jgi:multidrug efflux pump subunit AcrB